MIRRATIKDLEAVNRVMKHPDVYPHTWHDGRVPVEQFTAKNLLLCAPPVHVLIDDQDSFVATFTPDNNIMWVVHDNALPEVRGKYARDAGRAMLDWMFTNTPCLKVIGRTPYTNPRARMFAQMVGFTIEGRLKNAYMLNGKLYDMWVVGICKEDFYNVR